MTLAATAMVVLGLPVGGRGPMLAAATAWDGLAAANQLKDPFARIALILARGTGIRLGELLDLELDRVWDSSSHGSWLKVPLGKLGTERFRSMPPRSRDPDRDLRAVAGGR